MPARKKSDILVLLLIAAIIFGGMYFLKNKQLDPNQMQHSSRMRAAGY